MAGEDEGKTTIWILLKKELKNKDMIYKGGETPLLLAADEGARGRGERGGEQRRRGKVRDLRGEVWAVGSAIFYQCLFFYDSHQPSVADFISWEINTCGLC
jgi:hypothetical protein